MKKLLVCLLFTLFFSCNSGQPFESRVQKYMKDSVVPNFNDPASYEYVSMGVDSIMNHSIILDDQAKHLRDLKAQLEEKHTNEMQYISDKHEFPDDKRLLESDEKVDSMHNLMITLLNSQISGCDIKLKQPDSLHHLNVTVKCRAKNKMGGLILNEVELRYYPKIDKITQ